MSKWPSLQPRCTNAARRSQECSEKPAAPGRCQSYPRRGGGGSSSRLADISRSIINVTTRTAKTATRLCCGRWSSIIADGHDADSGHTRRASLSPRTCSGVSVPSCPVSSIAVISHPSECAPAICAEAKAGAAAVSNITTDKNCAILIRMPTVCTFHLGEGQAPVRPSICPIASSTASNVSMMDW